MWQTINDIQEEIKALNARGSKAWNALQRLPTGFIEFEEHKKRQAKIQKYNSEINAVKQIIIYAKEAIDYEMQKLSK